MTTFYFCFGRHESSAENRQFIVGYTTVGMPGSASPETYASAGPCKIGEEHRRMCDVRK